MQRRGQGISGGVKAARAGHQVIMSPTSHCYFDYRQSLQADEPGAWYAMLPLEMVYSYDPVPPEPAAASNGPQPMSLGGDEGAGAGEMEPSRAATPASSLGGDDFSLTAAEAQLILGAQV